MGDFLRIQGNLDEAIVESRTAVQLKPSSFESHTNLGNALSDQGKLDEAIAEYRHALRLQPDLALCHFNLGVGLSHLGKLDEACSEYKTALRLEPKNVWRLTWASVRPSMPWENQSRRLMNSGPRSDLRQIWSKLMPSSAGPCTIRESSARESPSYARPATQA